MVVSVNAAESPLALERSRLFTSCLDGMIRRAPASDSDIIGRSPWPQQNAYGPLMEMAMPLKLAVEAKRIDLAL